MRKKFLGILLAAGVIAAMTGCGSTNNVDGEKATADENGNYLINGSFEEADFTGWTVNNVNDSTEELDIYDRDTDCFEGVQSLHFYSGSSNVDFSAEQTVNGLEEGTYKLTAHIQGDAAGDKKRNGVFLRCGKRGRNQSGRRTERLCELVHCRDTGFEACGRRNHGRCTCYYSTRRMGHHR